MTFAQLADRSVSASRILFELDVGSFNLQWINAGAGIWYVNFAASYPEVDASLLDGFTAQTFGTIGSVRAGPVMLQARNTLLELASNPSSYYYDTAAGEVFICLPNYDEPWMYEIILGITHGYSFDGFTPTGSSIPYEGRLSGNPSVEISRDATYFGKTQFASGSIELINADGELDSLAEDGNIFGNPARLKFGFTDIDLSDYLTIYQGAIDMIQTTEESLSITLADPRKALSKVVECQTVTENGLDIIEDLLATHYGAQFNDYFYDTAEWNAAKASVDSVYIQIYSGGAIKDSQVISIIEMVCMSVFGMFIVKPDGRYSFKMLSATASASTSIAGADIISSHSISYDPSKIISSVKVGYDKDWSEGYTERYTYYVDTSHEASTYSVYKTYNQPQVLTALRGSASVLAFAQTFSDYYTGLHGTGSVTVPMKYWDVDLGDIVDIAINRESSTMLGTKKCEIIGKRYKLSEALIEFAYRIIS